MLDDLKRLFRGNNFIGQIILINAIVFVLVNVIAHLFMGGSGRPIQEWVALPSLLHQFIWVPWTIITYMFMHGGLWHLIFNMYMLYWFGQIFGSMMGEKRLIGLYFLGGIAGGLLFMLAYNALFLSGEPVGNTLLVGASAAVMAITIAAGARFPDYVVNLLFFGAVRLKYVALVIFITSTVLDFSSNMGGKIAHLGGAAMGYFYVRGLHAGSDYAMAFYQFFEQALSYFKRGPKLKVVKDKPKRGATRTAKSSPSSKSASKASGKNEDEIQAKTDAILDKISKSGYENLSREEKEFLFKLGNKP